MSEQEIRSWKERQWEDNDFHPIRAAQLMSDEINELRKALAAAQAEIKTLRKVLQKEAGQRVDRCACVLDENGEPVTECRLHADMRTENEALRKEIARLKGSEGAIAIVQADELHKLLQESQAKLQSSQKNAIVSHAAFCDARDTLIALRKTLTELGVAK